MLSSVRMYLLAALMFPGDEIIAGLQRNTWADSRNDKQSHVRPPKYSFRLSQTHFSILALRAWGLCMAWETKLRPRHGSLQLSLPVCVFIGTFVVSTVLGELAGRERGLEARGNLALLLWRSQARLWTLTLERTIVGALAGGGVGLPEPEAK